MGSKLSWAANSFNDRYTGQSGLSEHWGSKELSALLYARMANSNFHLVHHFSASLLIAPKELGRMTARSCQNSLRQCLLLMALFFLAGQTLAQDCGSKNVPCLVEAGEYHIAIPAEWENGPTVVHLHGYGSSGAKVLGNAGFVNQLASRGYALIAPTALPWHDGKPNDWSVRDGWQIYPRRDLIFLQEVISDAVNRFGVSPDQILLTGFSRGGSMVWDVACHSPNLALAYAPAAGGFWMPMPEKCSAPVNLLHTHGFTDPMVPLEGRSWHNDEVQFTISQADIWEGLQLWRNANTCPSNATEHEISDGIWRKEWKCEYGSLELILHKGGHGLPKGWATMVLDWFEQLGH
ncbi:alpha/beta hydrolase family esterase [Roseovarius aestuarii]|nr:polyhydroxybutyrate depolymerase [Roseovarius aestuarii]